MNLGIADRVAMVLGAGGGLGSAVAIALAREGARVAASDINRDALQATAQKAHDEGSSLVCVPFDMSDLAACDNAVDHVASELGPIEILVNITGGPPPTLAASNSAEVWRRHFDAMVTPVLHITDEILPQMRESGWGRIITSTSSGVITPIPNLGLSNVLRSALVGWSKTLAGEVGADGITVNVIVPGRIATSRIERLNEARAEKEGRTVDEISKESTATIPVGRYGRPEEFADVVTFLASDRSSFVHGSMIRVDGGMIPNV